jgi:hypothetical protein
MTTLNHPFVGSEAVADGVLRKHELRSRYRALFPDVYVPKHAAPTVHQRSKAAWLYTHRQGVIAGLTASALHGAKWVDDVAPIEVIWSNARRPRGLRTFDMRLDSTEWVAVGDMRVTTVVRTAFDIARRGRLDDAVSRLDALGNATGFRSGDVLAVADRHRGVRGLRQLRTALSLYDPGAASPKETWLRLLLIRAAATNSDTGAQPRRPSPVLPRHGVGRVQARRRIRRRAASCQSHCVRLRHPEVRGSRRARLDEDQGRQRESRARRSAAGGASLGRETAVRSRNFVRTRSVRSLAGPRGERAS